jgi:hypothetical protein
MRKNASKSDTELMRGIMAAIRVARAKYGNIESRRGFMVEVAGSKIPVVNSNRFPSAACLSRSLVEGTLPAQERPQELESVDPAAPVVAMRPNIHGAGYDTILFHELVHSQQIIRMWRRYNIDHSDKSHKDVVEGWRDRNLRVPKSPYVDEEYGSVHAEIHAYMMHTAYEAIRAAAARMNGGWDRERAERVAVHEAKGGAQQILTMLRSMQMTMPQDMRFINFMRRPAAEYGVDMDDMATKPGWRMGDEEWSKLNKRMDERMEFLVRSTVRDIAKRMERRELSAGLDPEEWTKVGASAGWLPKYAEDGWDPFRDGKCKADGEAWRVSDLARHAESLPVEMMDVDKLIEHNGDLEVKGHLLADEMSDPSEAFMKRVAAADMKFPILVNSDGWILDGAHRLAKAKWDGQQTIAAKVVDLSDIPGCSEGDGEGE